MGSGKTRRRQLQRLAERRMAERRRRRQRRVAIVLVLGILGLFGVGSAAAIFLQREPDATPSPTPSPTASPTGEAVACGGERPASAGQPKPTFEKPPKMQIDRQKLYRAVLETSCGTIELELFADRTPVTVNSFVFLARERFYDGLIFHRVILGFMNQSGDPKGDGTGGPGYEFKDEIVKGLRFDEPGLLAMANPGRPDSNGSQFFITVAPARHLNGKHTIFGQVAEGMDVVQEINALSPQGAERPTETVFIERVRIIEGE
jgi:cyclophilin family peptidyl-prolyl cis-trans isomerase